MESEELAMWTVPKLSLSYKLFWGGGVKRDEKLKTRKNPTARFSIRN